MEGLCTSEFLSDGLCSSLSGCEEFRAVCQKVPRPLQMALRQGRMTTKLAAMMPMSISPIAIVRGVTEVPGSGIVS